MITYTLHIVLTKEGQPTRTVKSIRFDDVSEARERLLAWSDQKGYAGSYIQYNIDNREQYHAKRASLKVLAVTILMSLAPFAHAGDFSYLHPHKPVSNPGVNCSSPGADTRLNIEQRADGIYIVNHPNYQWIKSCLLAKQKSTKQDSESKRN